MAIAVLIWARSASIETRPAAVGTCQNAQPLQASNPCAIALGETVGSIHRIGALAQGLEACNGWAFWHVPTAAGLVSIDALRAQIRTAMATL